MKTEKIGSLEINKIHHMDCLEGMKLLPNKSVDMVLADLPYGTSKCKWDTIIPLDKLWDQYKRIIKDDGIIALFAQSPFDKVLGASNLQMLKYEWVWVKSKPTGHLNAKYAPMKKHENILIFTNNPTSYTKNGKVHRYYIDDLLEPYGKEIKRKYKEESVYDKASNKSTIQKFKGHPVDVLNFNVVKKPSHPTEKPIDLCEYLISLYTKPNEVVLDNCIGSGTTGVAARNIGRNWIGFEIESKYVEIANGRLGTLIK